LSANILAMTVIKITLVIIKITLVIIKITLVIIKITLVIIKITLRPCCNINYFFLAISAVLTNHAHIGPCTKFKKFCQPF
jgi:hypothetical protein